MNKYKAQSRIKESKDNALLTWVIEDYEMGFLITFNDGTKRYCRDRKEIRRKINDKFYSTYF